MTKLIHLYYSSIQPMQMKTYISIISYFYFLLLTFISNGQDAHYWTEQYGNKSMLLSGTVNASVQDLGLVFYNPGRLAQIENPAFVISAKVYELNKIRLKDGVDKGKDLKKSTFGGAPNLVAGTFKVPFLKNHHFAYSFLTRYRYNSDLSTKASLDENDEKDSPYSNITAKANSKNEINEEWYGLTWSYNLSNVLSVGISTFASQANYTKSVELQLHGLRKDSLVSMVTLNRKMSYERYGLLWKAGLAAQFEKINLGLTVTTPTINVYNNGSTTYENYISRVDSLDGDPITDVYMESDQNNLHAKPKSPWAIGLGISFKSSKTTIHLSSEWFSGIGKYITMESKPEIGQYPKDTMQLRLIDDLKSVFNIGIGLEHRFNEKVEIFLSGSTDFAAVGNDLKYIYEFRESELSRSTFDGDIYLLGGGLALNMKWAELTLGATYATSQRTVPIPLDISGNDIINPEENTDLLYRRWRFIVGFSFPFANKLSEKLGTE